MAEPLVLTLPAHDTALRAELEKFLEPYGGTVAAPPSFGSMEDVKLFFETVGTFATSGITVTTLVYMLKDKFAGSKIKVGKPGEPGTDLDKADERVTRRLEDLGKD